MRTKLTARGISLLLEYTTLKYIRAYKDWMNTKAQRDWQVVEIYSDLLSKAGTDITLLRSQAMAGQAKGLKNNSNLKGIMIEVGSPFLISEIPGQSIRFKT